MAKIKVIAVGGMSRLWQEANQHYIKRIRHDTQLEIIQIREVNEKNINVKIRKETAFILKVIPRQAKVWLCSLEGTMMNSEAFANLIKNENDLCFVIGGSNGVDESQFSQKISFSKMTLPHQLFRIFLLEQIYRGLAINKGARYHK